VHHYDHGLPTCVNAVIFFYEKSCRLWTQDHRPSGWWLQSMSSDGGRAGLQEVEVCALYMDFVDGELLSSSMRMILYYCIGIIIRVLCRLCYNNGYYRYIIQLHGRFTWYNIQYAYHYVSCTAVHLHHVIIYIYIYIWVYVVYICRMAGYRWSIRGRTNDLWLFQSSVAANCRFIYHRRRYICHRPGSKAHV